MSSRSPSDAGGVLTERDQRRPLLTIELVPSTSWYSNVRSRVPKAAWDKIRRQVYAAAGKKCEICGGRGDEWPVECHEVWLYDDQKGIQKLERMIALCPPCHQVKHFGRTMLVGNSKAASAHIAKVNGWSEQKTKLYVRRQFDVWSRRSRHEWILDLTHLLQYGIDPDTTMADKTRDEDDDA